MLWLSFLQHWFQWTLTLHDAPILCLPILVHHLICILNLSSSVSIVHLALILCLIWGRGLLNEREQLFQLKHYALLVSRLLPPDNESIAIVRELGREVSAPKLDVDVAAVHGGRLITCSFSIAFFLRLFEVSDALRDTFHLSNVFVYLLNFGFHDQLPLVLPDQGVDLLLLQLERYKRIEHLAWSNLV